MISFQNIAEAVASVLATGSRAHVSAPGPGLPERGRIERLCRELAWSVDEQCEDGTICLRFNDTGLGAARRVLIAAGDKELVFFLAFSLASIPGRAVPKDVIGHLLTQNAKLPVGAWAVSGTGDGDVMFVVTYKALGAGLGPTNFRFICESLVREASDLDKRLRAAGLLRV